MATDTWNFACHECHDWPENPGGRGKTAGIFYSTLSSPFVDNFTAIFSVLMRTGWTNISTYNQTLFSLGTQGQSAFRIQIYEPGSTARIRIWLKQITTGTDSYHVYLGDEDGTSYMSADKWYQCAFSCSTSGATFAVNGSTTPLSFVQTDNLSIMDVGNAARCCLFGGAANANSSFIETISVGQTYPSMIVGPSAYSDQLLDLSDSAVLGRIFDSDGNFKNPGEDGSLWFGDTYGANTPNYFFAAGTPRVQNGTDTASWRVAGGDGYTGRWGAPGGLRKQYES